jgi:hypothetical protein
MRVSGDMYGIYWLWTSVVTLPLVLAYDPLIRECSSVDLCLTSFYWCAYPDPLSNHQQGCTAPPGGYVRGYDDRSTGSHFALLSPNISYNISWKKKHNYTVRVSWLFSTSKHTSATPRWQAGKLLYMIYNYIIQNLRCYLDTNESFFTFKPNDIIEEFPTPLAPDMSPDQARSFATVSFTNFIEISQPDQPPDEKGNYPRDSSEAFALSQELLQGFFDTQAALIREEKNRKWNLGVGIGIGIGIPLTIAMSGYGGWIMGRRY